MATNTSNTVNATPTAAGGGSGGPNEPTGMSVIANRSMNALNESWTLDFDYSGWNNQATTGTDAGDPESPSGVIDLNYPQGLIGGDGNLNRAIINFPQNYNVVYVHMTVKYDPNWQGHPAFNKLWYLGNSNATQDSGWNTYGGVSGGGSGGLTATVRGQAHAGTTDAEKSPEFSPNTGSGDTTRNQWYRWEYLFTSNTPNVKDGFLQAWRGVGTGTPVEFINYSNVGYIGTGYQSSDAFYAFQFDAIWGGLGSTVDADMWTRLGHIYISGKNV